MQLDEIEKNVIDDIIQTNLSAVIHITHRVLPYLRNAQEAAIINVTSQSWVVSQDGQSIYTASKYGVRGFTDVLKKDLKWSHIRVAWVYQAGTKTKMFENHWETMPLEKFAYPNDLADIVNHAVQHPL